MGYFQVRYDSRVINYNCRGFIRLATAVTSWGLSKLWHHIWSALLLRPTHLLCLLLLKCDTFLYLLCFTTMIRFCYDMRLTVVALWKIGLFSIFPVHNHTLHFRRRMRSVKMSLKFDGHFSRPLFRHWLGIEPGWLGLAHTS